MTATAITCITCLAVAVSACGGNRAKIAREMQDFDCRQRLVSYVATKHMSGDEFGVQIDCAEKGPRIKRWKTDRVGKRIADERNMTPGEFDKIWTEVDGTGWRNLRDCTNGSLGKNDPIFLFDVRDDQNQQHFECQTVQVPYPYDALVNPLDLAANQGRTQLGGDSDDMPRPDQKGKMK